MKVKKAFLETFFTVLRGTDGILSLADARIRDAFMKHLGEAVQTAVKERVAIYEKYCKKTKKGEPDIEDGTYKFETKDTAKVNKELEVFSEEIVELKYDWGVTPSKLKEIIEKSDYKPKYGEAEIIDAIIAEIK